MEGQYGCFQNVGHFIVFQMSPFSLSSISIHKCPVIHHVRLFCPFYMLRIASKCQISHHRSGSNMRCGIGGVLVKVGLQNEGICVYVFADDFMYRYSFAGGFLRGLSQPDLSAFQTGLFCPLSISQCSQYRRVQPINMEYARSEIWLANPINPQRSNTRLFSK